MTKTMLISCAAAISLFAGGAALAQPGGGWRIIGFKSVGGGTDRDVVDVRGDQRHSQIMLCSLNRPIRMVDLDVRFANGGRQDVRVRERLNAGSCTRAIDLKGRQRDITQVRLRYERIQRGMMPPLVRVLAR